MQVFIVKRGVYEEETCLGVFANEALARGEASRHFPYPRPSHPMFEISGDKLFAEMWEASECPRKPNIAQWSERSGNGEWLSIEAWTVQGA